tara:strand:+ start:121 stop:321 length:201 start_codon:yes stop_codon:yes gene_type:complete
MRVCVSDKVRVKWGRIVGQKLTPVPGYPHFEGVVADVDSASDPPATLVIFDRFVCIPHLTELARRP